MIIKRHTETEIVAVSDDNTRGFVIHQQSNGGCIAVIGKRHADGTKEAWLMPWRTLAGALAWVVRCIRDGVR